MCLCGIILSKQAKNGEISKDDHPKLPLLYKLCFKIDQTPGLRLEEKQGGTTAPDIGFVPLEEMSIKTVKDHSLPLPRGCRDPHALHCHSSLLNLIILRG